MVKVKGDFVSPEFGIRLHASCADAAKGNIDSRNSIIVHVHTFLFVLPGYQPQH